MSWMLELKQMADAWFQWKLWIASEDDLELRCESSQAKRLFVFHETPEPWL